MSKLEGASDSLKKRADVLDKEIKKTLDDFQQREKDLMEFLLTLDLSPRKEDLSPEDSKIVEAELDSEEETEVQESN